MHALREGFKALSGFDVEVLEFDGRRSTERQARPGWANARDVVAVYDKMMAARNDRVCDEAEEMPRFVATDVQTAINEMLLHRPEGLSRRKMHEDASAWFHLTEHLNLNIQRQQQQQQQDAVRNVEREERFQDVTDAIDETEAAVCLPTEEEAAKAEEKDFESKSEQDKERLREEDKRLAKEEDERLQRQLQAAKDEAARRAVDLEQRKRQKLRQMSNCPMGFMWYQVSGGWRCGGGSHYVSDASLDREMGN